MAREITEHEMREWQQNADFYLGKTYSADTDEVMMLAARLKFALDEVERLKAGIDEEFEAKKHRELEMAAKVEELQKELKARGDGDGQ